MESSNDMLQSLLGHWDKASTLTRILLLILIVALVVVAIMVLPFRDEIWIFFQGLPDAVKVIVFLAMLVWLVERSTKLNQLKNSHKETKAEVEKLRSEVARNDERLAALLEVESRANLWQKKCNIVRPVFIPPNQRKTRFVTVLNLKGGVGKTMLTANLAACLALDPKPLRVLLVDLDFQGTLGQTTVDPQFLAIQDRNKHYVQKLLEDVPYNAELLPRLRIDMMGVSNAQVILAADSLDLVDFELQARFFLDSEEDPRFRLISQLHQKEVFDAYDIVVFDCPPRITVSVVNAILCSDYIIIPTRLDVGSINAVPRTVSWIKSLGPLCSATILGVLGMHVSSRGGKLVKADQLNYERLRKEVQSALGSDVVFKEVVRTSTDALNLKAGLVASTDVEKRQVFSKVVTEFRERIGL